MLWGEEHAGAVLVDMYAAELAAYAWDLVQATLDRLDPFLPLSALNAAGRL